MIVYTFTASFNYCILFMLTNDKYPGLFCDFKADL